MPLTTTVLLLPPPPNPTPPRPTRPSRSMTIPPPPIIIWLKEPLLPTIRVVTPVPSQAIQRVPLPVTRTEFVFAPRCAPTTLLPPENTAAPLLTTSRLPAPSNPTFRFSRLLHAEPASVTTATLLFAPEK